MHSIDSSRDVDTITPGQLRAARALLGWSREKASAECGVGWATLSRFERGERIPLSTTLEAVVEAFSAAGILFFRDGDMVGVGIAERSGSN